MTADIKRASILTGLQRSYDEPDSISCCLDGYEFLHNWNLASDIQVGHICSLYFHAILWIIWEDVQDWSTASKTEI